MSVDGSTIDSVRIAFGGVAPKPWRSREAEEVLEGNHPTIETFRAAADAAMLPAVGRGHNDFKIDLAKRTLVAVLVKLTEGRGRT